MARKFITESIKVESEYKFITNLAKVLPSLSTKDIGDILAGNLDSNDKKCKSFINDLKNIGIKIKDVDDFFGKVDDKFLKAIDSNKKEFEDFTFSLV